MAYDTTVRLGQEHSTLLSCDYIGIAHKAAGTGTKCGGSY